MSNTTKDVSYRLKNTSTSNRKNRGSWRAVAFLMIFAGITLAVAYSDMSRVAEKAEAYSSPNKLTEAVREESKQCIGEMSVIDCANDTKALEQKAEILEAESETRKDIINQLFEDDTQN
jgi:hypothetical protein